MDFREAERFLARIYRPGDEFEVLYTKPDGGVARVTRYAEPVAGSESEEKDFGTVLGEFKRAEEAGYKGQPIRIMVSKQYDFHFKMAQVAAEYLRAAGFEVDLQVIDWATLLQRRNDPAVWEIFYTHAPILPEPTLYSFFNSAAPGWWSTPAHDATLTAFNTEPNPEARAAKWAADRFSAPLYQEALTELITSGQFERYLRRAGARNAGRRHALITELHGRLGDRVRSPGRTPACTWSSG